MIVRSIAVINHSALITSSAISILLFMLVGEGIYYISIGVSVVHSIAKAAEST